MELPKENKNYFYLFCLLLIPVLFFAIFYDWEYDEAWSYLAVKNSSVPELLLYSKFKFANNHIINSLYFKFLEHFNITTVFFYRLLSIVGFALFYFASIKILQHLKISYLFVIPIVIAPYYIYFSLGRGYGLAIGCVVMAVLYLIEYVKYPSTKNEWLLVVFGLLSCISLFSFLYGFIAIFCVYLFFKRKDGLNFRSVPLYLLVLGALAYIYHAGKIVADYDPNIIASASLIKNGTIGSIVTDLSYYSKFQTYWFYKYLKTLIAIALIVPCLYFSILLFFKKMPGEKFTIEILKIIIVLIIISVGMIALAHIITTHAKYPLGRAVYYLQYFILLFITAATVTYAKKKWLYYLPIVLLLAISTVSLAALAYDQTRPGIKEVLLETGDQPLYVINISPGIPVTNSLFDIHKQNVFQGKHSAMEVDSIAISNSKNGFYLFCPITFADSINFKVEKIYRCRDNYGLYKTIK